MGFHTFDPDETDRLEDPTRFRFCSREELLQGLPDGGTVLDLGSGSGFYTDELAPFFDRLVAFDLQPAMHQQYGDRGVPESVVRVTGDAGSLPFGPDRFDAAVSTMTFHESTSERSIRELDRVLAEDAPFVCVDWSADGRGEAGPPLSERYSAADARRLLADSGFAVEVAAERSETFSLLARR
jgi:SAM-dependent methyltransferase